jgi:HlyD family type I secretion membrane fusion protein
LISFARQCRAAARAGDAELARILAGQRGLFAARRTSKEGEIAILKRRIAGSEDEIGGLEAQRLSRIRQAAIIDDELTGLRTLFEKGYTPRTRILALERNREELQGEQGELTAGIVRAGNAIAESQLQIVQLDKRFREQVLEELRQVRAEIHELSERRIAAADERRRTDIVAPRAGIVVGLDVFTPGGVITPGQPILHIVPSDDEHIVEAQLRPEDIDRVAAGQAAIVRFPAFNARTTPALQASVLTVSADRLIDKITGAPYYQALGFAPCTT